MRNYNQDLEEVIDFFCQADSLLGVWNRFQSFIKDLQYQFQPELDQVQKIMIQTIHPFPQVAGVIDEFIYSTNRQFLRPLLGFYSVVSRGPIPWTVIQWVAGMEMIHSASLCHDDVLDRQPIRRGLPSFWSQKGSSLSILVGDFLFAQALNLIAQIPIPSLVSLASNACCQMVLGEISQIYLSFSSVDPFRSYQTIIAQKTGALLEATCQGAYDCFEKVNEKQPLAIDSQPVARRWGIFFQMLDDWLDYIPSVERGKEPGRDFFDYKITIPILEILQSSLIDQKEKEKLRILFINRPPITQKDYKWVCRLVDRICQSNRPSDLLKHS